MAANVKSTKHAEAILQSYLENESSHCLKIRLDACVTPLTILWSMIRDLTVEVWQQDRDRVNKGHDFHAALGDPKDLLSLVHPVERLLEEATGDRIQTLQITSEFFQKKARIQGRELSKVKKERETLLKSLTEPESILKIVGDALAEESKKVANFVKMIDDTFLKQMEKHFTDWNDVKSPILPISFIHHVFELMQQEFLSLCHVFTLFGLNDRDRLPSSKDSDRVFVKHLRFLELFLNLVRVRSKFTAVNCSLCVTFAQLARGVKSVDMQILVARRIAASKDTAIRFLNKRAEQSRKNLTMLLVKKPTLYISLDNYQEIRSVNAQRNGDSSTKIDGTVRFVRKNFAVPPTCGSRIRSLTYNQDFIVIGVAPITDSQGRQGYYYHIAIGFLDGTDRRTTIAWPNQ